MWIYEKKLEYPVKIVNPNPRMAKYIITQYGGPDGELNLWHVQIKTVLQIYNHLFYIQGFYKIYELLLPFRIRLPTMCLYNPSHEQDFQHNPS